MTDTIDLATGELIDGDTSDGGEFADLSEEVPASGPRFDIDDGEIVILTTNTLRGDIRDEILKRFKSQPKPWTVMSEFEQRELIGGIDRVAGQLVADAVRIIAANGHPYAEGTLIKVETKDILKTQVNFRRDIKLRHLIADRTGQSVIIVLCNADDFDGERAPAQPDPEQPPLPMGDGGNVAAFRGRD